ncbi:MAG: thermonuclease family protein [Candidatus Paceibacterota bacterium]|jgi:micrococcal nuclease
MKKSKKILPLVVILLALLATFAKEIYKPNSAEYNNIETSASNLSSFEAEVLRIIDGDTVEIFYDGKKDTLRLTGIDAPEWGSHVKAECYGEEASVRMKELSDGKSIVVVIDGSQSDRDMYGRLLGYMYLKDGTFVNQKMIEQGYAEEYRFKTSYAHEDQFKSAEADARLKNLGIWGGCSL